MCVTYSSSPVKLTDDTFQFTKMVTASHKSYGKREVHKKITLWNSCILETQCYKLPLLNKNFEVFLSHNDVFVHFEGQNLQLTLDLLLENELHLRVRNMIFSCQIL